MVENTIKKVELIQLRFENDYDAYTLSFIITFNKGIIFDDRRILDIKNWFALNINEIYFNTSVEYHEKSVLKYCVNKLKKVNIEQLKIEKCSPYSYFINIFQIIPEQEKSRFSYPYDE